MKFILPRDIADHLLPNGSTIHAPHAPFLESKLVELELSAESFDDETTHYRARHLGAHLPSKALADNVVDLLRSLNEHQFVALMDCLTEEQHKIVGNIIGNVLNSETEPECGCIEGNDMSLTTCCVNNCPVHGSDDASDDLRAKRKA